MEVVDVAVILDGLAAKNPEKLDWKKSIVDLMKLVGMEGSLKGSPDFVKHEERIATFDNDGTMWVEQPNYTQVIVAIDEVVAMAPPSIRNGAT